METEGLILLIRALEKPCCCEKGGCGKANGCRNNKDCRPKLNRFYQELIIKEMS